MMSSPMNSTLPARYGSTRMERSEPLEASRKGLGLLTFSQPVLDGLRRLQTYPTMNGDGLKISGIEIELRDVLADHTDETNLLAAEDLDRLLALEVTQGECFIDGVLETLYTINEIKSFPDTGEGSLGRYLALTRHHLTKPS